MLDEENGVVVDNDRTETELFELIEEEGLDV